MTVIIIVSERLFHRPDRPSAIPGPCRIRSNAGVVAIGDVRGSAGFVRSVRFSALGLQRDPHGYDSGSCGMCTSPVRGSRTILCKLAVISVLLFGVLANPIANSPRAAVAFLRPKPRKKHLCAIDKDHQVHDFQIICSTRFGLSEVSISVRRVSQIATALAVRESVFVVIFEVTFTFLPPVIVYTRLRRYRSSGIQIAEGTW